MISRQAPKLISPVWVEWPTSEGFWYWRRGNLAGVCQAFMSGHDRTKMWVDFIGQDHHYRQEDTADVFAYRFAPIPPPPQY